MDDSKIIYDKVIESYDEEIKTIPTNFNKKKVTWKTQGFYILIFIFINYYSILIAVSINC